MQKHTHRFGAPIVYMNAMLLYPVSRTIFDAKLAQQSLNEEGTYSYCLWGEFALMVTDEPFDFHIQTLNGYRIISKENVDIQGFDDEIHLHVTLDGSPKVLKYTKTNCTIQLPYIDLTKLESNQYTITDTDRFSDYRYVISENEVFGITEGKLSNITTDGKQMVYVDVLDQY